MDFVKKIFSIVLAGLSIIMATPVNSKISEDFQKQIVAYQSSYLANGTFFVAKKNHKIFSTQIGYANYPLKLAFNNDMPFPIASLSKQFTAAAILLLLEEQKLALDHPIIEYLPMQHPLWQAKVPAWAHKVTIHQLLTHSSGIPSYTNEKIPDVASKRDDEVIPYIISYMKDKPLLFTPGEKFDYNNTGYLLLCVIIETLSPEKSYSEFLANRLFKPIKMNNSFLPTIAMERSYINQINRDNGLIRYIANLENINNLPVPMTEIHLEVPLAGAAYIFSTVNDLLTWNLALYGGKVLSPDSLKLMTQVHMQGEDSFFGPIKYGYGIFINNDDNKNVIYYHGGWLQGIRTQLSYAPKNQTSVICFSNLSPDESQDDKAQEKQVKSFHDLAMSLQSNALRY